jgi:hypothetical protein
MSTQRSTLDQQNYNLDQSLYPGSRTVDEKCKEFPALNWYNLQKDLEEDPDYDVLLILDCCHAGAATTKSSGPRLEILAACARQEKAQGM